MDIITLTERAKKYMRSVVLNKDYVCLSVKGGGCSGLQYVWDLKEIFLYTYINLMKYNQILLVAITFRLLLLEFTLDK